MIGLNAYWFSTLTYTILLIIFFINDSVTKRVVTKVERVFRIMTLWVIFFCLQDTFWGLCAIGFFEGETLLFVSSTIFHLSTVITSFYWLYFVLIYLNIDSKRRNIYLLLDSVIVLCHIGFVISNIFTPTIFSIVNGQYVTEFFRPYAFFDQYIVYLCTGIGALLTATGIVRVNNQSHQTSYITIVVASMAPILLGIFQLLFPYSPLYSLSYFLACYLVHIFVVAKERQQADMATIFQSISRNYYSMHLIDLETGKVVRYIEPPILTNLIQQASNPQDMVNNVVRGTATDEYKNILFDFVNFSTISERMAKKNYISCEFVGANYGWTNISFASVEKVGDKQKQVMVYTQIIDNAKRHEIDLIFKSNNDELTGLYNRYAYENRLKEISEKWDDDSLVLIALDINGLKKVNDTLGHAAGDELIIGAASCMKQCFFPYGKIFRTGGDEFFAIINADKNKLASILTDFDNTIMNWHGDKIDSLSISYGCVRFEDVEDRNIHTLANLADKRMYENKAAHYQKLGIKRVNN